VSTVTVHSLATTYAGQPVATPAQADPAEWAHFAAQTVVIPGGCHLWLGELFGAGYGLFATTTAPSSLFDVPRKALIGAHRYAYVAHNGPLPEGAQVRHRTCDEPLCVHREHLMCGDAWDNARDREEHGRGARAKHGVRQYRADTRPRLQRSLDLQNALRSALVCGASPADLPGVVADVYAEGDPMRDQLPLWADPPRHLRLVR
jgi:hypothetical protein